MEFATQEVPVSFLGPGVRTAVYGLLVVTIIGELLRDLRALTTHQLLNIHRLQCTVYAVFACATAGELFLHGWNAFSDRQLICIFALLHTANLPPFWHSGRPCALLFKSVFPILELSTDSSLVCFESSRTSVPPFSPSRTQEATAGASQSPPTGSTTVCLGPEAQDDIENRPPGSRSEPVSPPGATPGDPSSHSSPTAYTALCSVHRGLAGWFLVVMALELAWMFPALMFWAHRYRDACVEPTSTAHGPDCEAYAFFMFLRVRAYGWMRWLQLAWYSAECMKSVSLICRVSMVLGEASRIPLLTPAARPTASSAERAENSEGDGAAGGASCSHGSPRAAPTHAGADSAAEPLLPGCGDIEGAAGIQMAGECAPRHGFAGDWAKAQRAYASALLHAERVPSAVVDCCARPQLSMNRIFLKVLLGSVVLGLTVATVELNMVWNAVQGGPAGWDFAQVLAVVAMGASVLLMGTPGADAKVSLVEDTYFGGNA